MRSSRISALMLFQEGFLMRMWDTVIIPPQVHIEGYDEEPFKLTEQQVLEYIAKVRDAYNNIL